MLPLFSSSIVLKSLTAAHKAGKDFRVIVVDSRPKLEGTVGKELDSRPKLEGTVGKECQCVCVCVCACVRACVRVRMYALHPTLRPRPSGRECLHRLVKSGIKCSYILINAVSYIMKEVSDEPGYDSLLQSYSSSLSSPPPSPPQGDEGVSGCPCLARQWLRHVPGRHLPGGTSSQDLQCARPGVL